MVKVAIAGGLCEIAREIVDHLLATRRHEIIILPFKEPTATDHIQQGTRWVQANYSDKNSLVGALQGVHTVLCFIPSHNDPEGKIQKSLIDAAVEAGVKRFAPSEWSFSDSSILPWHHSKSIIREYLAELNKEKTVLEYTLFQPGLLLETLAPNPYSNHSSHTPRPLSQTPTLIPLDTPNRRAILPDTGDDKVVYTSLRDVGAIVTRAISHPRPWPVNGGIRGNLVSLSSIISLAERLRGGEPFKVERVNTEELQKGVGGGHVLRTSWVPKLVGNPATPHEDTAMEMNSRFYLPGVLLGIPRGAYVVGDEWNRELGLGEATPEQQGGQHKLLGLQEFLERAWGVQSEEISAVEDEDMESVEGDESTEPGNLA